MASSTTPEDTLENISDQLSRLTVPESTVALIRDQELGRGAYGRVLKARHRRSVCAAKEIHSILIDAAYTPAERRRLQDNFIRECYHCSKLKHPNIVHFIGIYHPPQLLFPVIIMELMDESLTVYAQKPDISFKRRMSILHDVAEGLNYLHSRDPPVIHRDLSPNNILLNHLPLLPVAKIADLGVAKVVNLDDKSSTNYQTKVPGTVDFMPLEAFGDKPQYDTSLDVFSYGGIMLYTVNGKWPRPTALADFDPVTRQAKAYTEVERRQEYLDKMIGEAEILRPLVEACLDNDPAKRPSILELSKRIKPLKESPGLIPALQSGCYELIWENCADLPLPLYSASVALHDNKVYTMAGGALGKEAYKYVYVYDINSNQWDRLPPPGQHKSRLQIIDSKLAVIGGVDNITNNTTNKVTTYNNNNWSNDYPNLLKARVRPGVLTHLDYVIVAGGILDDNTYSDDIELLNYKQSSHWVVATMKLPEAMCLPSLTISDDMLYVVGYSIATGRSCAAFKAPIDTVTSSPAKLTSKMQASNWTELPPAPHASTTIIPNSCPPVIIGGHDTRYVPTVDIRELDVPNNSWKIIASLTTAKVSTAVIPINDDSILVIGGHTGGRNPEEAKAHCVNTVEKGNVRLCYAQ